MLPANPPFPRPRKRPFQPSEGIQTSIAIDESALGVATACTRQNAGSALNAVAARGGIPSGNGNAPAVVVSALTILTFGSESLATASHDGVCWAKAQHGSSNNSAARVHFMARQRSRS